MNVTTYGANKFLFHNAFVLFIDYFMLLYVAKINKIIDMLGI